jgi:hypothetical protein
MGTSARLVPKSPRIDRKWREFGRRGQEPGRASEALQPCGFRRPRDSAHDPLAMQKVVGSSPIIRFTKAPLDGVFCCLRRNRCRLVDLICAHLCPFKRPIVGPAVRS